MSPSSLAAADSGDAVVAVVAFFSDGKRLGGLVRINGWVDLFPPQYTPSISRWKRSE